MIRDAAVAGHFYSGEARTLLEAVRSYLTEPEPQLEGKAVVVPHAGYIYSGPIAGAVYSAVRLPGRFILLGPNHTGYGRPLSLHPAGEWRTPLGLARVDGDLNRLLLDACSDLREDRAAHTREHSIEVQIPFLQALVPGFTFSAVCVGTADLAALKELGLALARALKSFPEPALLVSSSDMNHYESAAVGGVKDRLAIEHVLAVDPEGLHRVVRSRDISMCGFAPTVAVLYACRELGSTRGRLVRYGHSGEVSGDTSHVVGYAGMVIH